MNRRTFLKNAALGSFGFLASRQLSAKEIENRPNIILILTDDLGYGDLGCYGSKLNSTPNIDRMAAQGVRLTDFYAAAWCAPSRCGLMTGCHPNRPGMLERTSVKLAKRITIAEMLKEKGYTTSLIGKWDLGMVKGGTHPLDQGFDYWYGTRSSNDRNGPNSNHASFREEPESAWKTPVYRNRDKEGACPQSEFIKRYTDETIQQIKGNKDKPFFIYLSHNMPHVPVFASERFRGKSRNGVYGDVLMELDWSTEKIMEALEQNGISSKTLVIFTSDNGPDTRFKEFGGNAGLLRGGKLTTWEGGGRVPCIFHWPDKIKPSVSSAFTVNTDIYATLANFTGSTIDSGQAVDSNDMSDVLLSRTEGIRKKHIYYFHQPMAYRNGDYKIHFFTHSPTINSMTGRGDPVVSHSPPLLFNLREDIGESRNLAIKNPKIVKRLTDEFYKAQKAINSWEKYD